MTSALVKNKKLRIHTPKKKTSGYTDRKNAPLSVNKATGKVSKTKTNKKSGFCKLQSYSQVSGL